MHNLELHFSVIGVNIVNINCISVSKHDFKKKKMVISKSEKKHPPFLFVTYLIQKLF